MRLTASVFIFLIINLTAKSQTDLAVSSIPKTLLYRAGAVVRSSVTTIEVKELDEVYFREKFAITILNPSALDKAGLYLNYDKNTSIKSIKGTIYNELGVPVSKISEKNFADRSSVSDISLYEDDRVKYFSPAQVNYPFTIEYEYELKFRQSLYIPSWIPSRDVGIAIENSTLKFICYESFKLRHKEFNYSNKVDSTFTDGIKTYQWTVNNLNALRDEPYSPNYEDYLVSVKLAANEFAFRNLKGSFANWKEYGLWTNENLLKGRDKIPESTQIQIQDLVKDIKDPKEKARKIYEFVQNKTRYISVQIGLGGYQPYSAADVDRLGYGDCKGLVNYTHSLLKTVGIESYYSIVHAGSFKKNMSPDFPSMQGNHIILCLPFKNDTTWLECTSKFAPFGFLGDFTDDRFVLACTTEGGKIMKTPKLSAMDNKQLRQAEFKIGTSGLLSGIIKTSFMGSQYDNHHILLNENYQDQLKKLPELYPLPNLEIKSFTFNVDKGAKPQTNESLELSSVNYGSIIDNNLRFNLNLINKMSVLKEVRNRVNPVTINRGYYDEDIYKYEIPAGYKISQTPIEKALNTMFGKYSTNVSIKDNIVTYKRTMLLNEGNFKRETYPELVDFFQEIADLDNLYLVLTKL